MVSPQQLFLHYPFVLTLICCYCIDSPYMQLPSGIFNFSRVLHILQCGYLHHHDLLQGLAGSSVDYLLCYLEHLLLLLSLWSVGLFLAFFFLHSSLGQFFCPFLNPFSAEVPCPWLQGSAMPPAAPHCQHMSICTQCNGNNLSYILSIEELRF